MDDEIKIQKFVEELKLREYSNKTISSYVGVVTRFLRSGKTVKDFLLLHSNKSRAFMRTAYFALKSFYGTVFKDRFDESIPLAKKEFQLPVVLSRDEVQKLFEVTKNLKHRLVLGFLYYAGLRLDEAGKIKWQDIDFQREVVNIKKGKGNKDRTVFLHDKLKKIIEECGIKEQGFVLVSERGSNYNVVNELNSC